MASYHLTCQWAGAQALTQKSSGSNPDTTDMLLPGYRCTEVSLKQFLVGLTPTRAANLALKSTETSKLLNTYTTPQGDCIC